MRRRRNGSWKKRKGETRRRIMRKVERKEKDKYGKGRKRSCRERKGG
jgi:hypothetical protein